MRLALLLTAFLSLALAGEAAAEPYVLTDDQGRSMLFDVRVAGADVEWYSDILRDAPHADEISTVRVHIVDGDELAQTCGPGAFGCYEGRTITVPATETQTNAHTLVHEYGHHVDASLRVSGRREPNGSRTWWRARGMERLVQLRAAYHGYTEGWRRNVAEIFAEDYARAARPGAPHKIGWLHPPTPAVLAAIRHDLGLGAAPTPTAPPQPKLVSYPRDGALAARGSASVSFGLLGPERRVRATVTVGGESARGVRARLVLSCDRKLVATRTLATGQRAVTLDRPALGPAERCVVTLTNTGTASHSYSLRVRLSLTL